MLHEPMSRLNLLVIRSQNIDSAARLYAALGLNLVKHAHGSGPDHYASESDGSVFEIYPLGKHQPPTTATRLGFEVTSVLVAIEAVQAMGGQLVSPLCLVDGRQKAVVSDLDGHKIELLAAATHE